MKGTVILFALTLLLACNDSTTNHARSALTLSKSSESENNQNISCDSMLNEMLKAGQGQFGQTGAVPDNFEKSLEQIDRAFDNGSRQLIKCLPDGGLDSLTHGGPGTVIKHMWLGNGSKLSEDLTSKGLTNKDDMVTIILTSYQRKVKNENIRFADQVKELTAKE